MSIQKSLFHRLRREVLKIIPPVGFFFLAFHLSLIVRHLSDEGFGINAMRSANATLAALILGKIYLLIDGSSWINRFERQPLIVTTLVKTLLYAALTLLAVSLEENGSRLLTEGLLQTGADLMATIRWPRALANVLILFLSVFLFTAVREANRVLGSGLLIRLFFSRHRPRKG